MWEERLKLYNEIVAQSSRFERKGKTIIPVASRFSPKPISCFFC